MIFTRELLHVSFHIFASFLLVFLPLYIFLQLGTWNCDCGGTVPWHRGMMSSHFNDLTTRRCSLGVCCLRWSRQHFFCLFAQEPSHHFKDEEERHRRT